MERSGRAAPSVQDADLVDVALAEGPVATVFLSTDPAIENASQHSEARWRAVRDGLRQQGAPEEVLAHVDDAVPAAHERGGRLAVVAAADGLRLVAHGPLPEAHDLGRWAPLPSLATVISWRQLAQPHVVALIDRAGADLTVAGPRTDDSFEVAPARRGPPLHKASSGGWHMRHEHRHVEKAWSENAGAVAGAIAEVARPIDAQLLVLAGDQRATDLVRAKLPADLAPLVTVIDGGRNPDGSADHVAEEVERAVRTSAAKATVEALERFKEERGQHDRAADGPLPTIEALQRAQVDVLVVHDDPADERTAWFGEEPTQLGALAEDVRSLGAPRPQEGRLVDVVVRAALGTGAGVRVVPGHGGPTGGVGALLRWS